MELSGQVVIVTGAGRGIGRATALELAGMGADIVVAELDQAGAERTAAEVKGLGRRVSAVRTDVTSRADLKAMAERARAEFGRIDILINAVGGSTIIERPAQARVICFLASADADFVTGVTIDVTGGL